MTVNVRGTTRLTSAAIGEVVNRVCDVVIWLMSENACYRELRVITLALIQEKAAVNGGSGVLYSE